MAAADELGSDQLHPEHLFAGLLACAGPAREALEACGVTRQAALDSAEHLAGSEKDRGKVRSGRLNNPGATAVAARAHGLAIGSGAVTVEAEHVLMAFLWGPKADSLSWVLKKAGATPDMLLAELRKRGVGTPAVPLPVPVAWGPLVRVTREEFERLALEARAAKRLYCFNYQGADVLVSFQEAE
jgi:hypothetical protein